MCDGRGSRSLQIALCDKALADERKRRAANQTTFKLLRTIDHPNHREHREWFHFGECSHRSVPYELNSNSWLVYSIGPCSSARR